MDRTSARIPPVSKKLLEYTGAGASPLVAGHSQPSPSKNSQSLPPAISNSLPINFSLNGWPSATERTPPSLSPQNSAMACKSLSYKPLFCTSLQPFSPFAMAKHSLSSADSPPASSTTSLLSLALSPTFSAELGNSSYQCPNALVTSGIPHHEKEPWHPSRRNILEGLLLPSLGQKGLYPAATPCSSLPYSLSPGCPLSHCSARTRPGSG